jgi:hypothetical protein
MAAYALGHQLCAADRPRRPELRTFEALLTAGTGDRPGPQAVDRAWDERRAHRRSATTGSRGGGAAAGAGGCSRGAGFASGSA